MMYLWYGPWNLFPSIDTLFELIEGWRIYTVRSSSSDIVMMIKLTG
jgi:hypothetical protein